MRELAITAVGSDRPGIVAGITQALLGLGGNLEDCRAALLRGSFAIALAVAVPDEVASEEVREALRPVAAELGLGLWVGEAEPAASTRPGERCVVSVYGADHPGIVHAVSRTLAERAVNIVDLSSRVVGDPLIYVLGIEVELPEGMEPSGLESALRPVAQAQGVELAIEAESDEVL